MIISIIEIVIGIYVVLRGADYLTDGAVCIAQRLKMPEMLIGLTVVALGTSMPELFVSLASALAGTTDIAVANVVGSNIFNVLLIGGLSAAIAPMTIFRSTVKRDIPVAVAASLLLLGFGLVGEINRLTGALFLLLLIIYMVWAQGLLALRLRLCARRLLASGYRDGAMWFFLLAAAALILWMGLGKLPAAARAGQIILAVLGLTGAVVLLLAAPKMRLERVLPLWGNDVVPVLRSALPATGVLGWGLAAAFLAGEVRPRDDRKSWYGLFWGVGGCVVLALGQLVILGNLGPTLAARLEDPFFTLAKSVGVEGAFQRVESVVAALWTLADLAMGVVLLFGLQTMAKELNGKLKIKRWTAASVALAVVLALTFFANGRAERWNRTVVPWVNLILAFGLAVLLLPGFSRTKK